MENCRDNMKILKEGLDKTGKFNVVSKDVGVPLVAFSLKDSSKYTVFDISENLRKFGWVVPAYTMPPNAEHVAVLRVVIREDFSRSLAERLLNDLLKVTTDLDAHPVKVSTNTAHVSLDGNGKAKKDVVEIEREATKYWKQLADRKKINGIC